MEIKLSILICTTSARSEVIKPLIESLTKQIYPFRDQVELLFNGHETDNVGKKRNDLLSRAKGEWQVSIDSDDSISEHYILLIMAALVYNPDCVGINGVITTNGINERKWFISKSYPHWFERNKVYYRTPNHICPIRTSIALKAGFPEIPHGEDHEFSKRVKPLIKSERIIDLPLYSYNYRNDERK